MKRISMKPIVPLLFSLLFFMPITAQAVDVDGLYSALIAVDNESNNRKLQRTAFKNVLVKVSGNPLVANNPVIKKALNRARDYLVKQSEVRIDEQAFLNASFNEKKINRLLRSSQFGVWGKNRPQQVVWLVVDENFARSIKGESDFDYAEFIKTTQMQANERAIPLLFPIMDLDDELQVTSSDLWGQFTAPIELASARYSADNYIIVKMIKNIDDYQFTWSLYGRNHQKQSYEIWLNGNSQGQLADLGFELSNSIANYLGDKYSVKVSGKNELVFLNIDRISEITSYAKVMKMFSSLSAVGQADLASVTGSSIQLKLTLLGTPEDLLEELSLDPRIISVKNSFGDTRFEWANK